MPGAEAARRVGVSLSCGSLWFIDAGSVKISESKPISSRYFSQDDRIEIADGLSNGEPVKAIAARIGKSYQSVVLPDVVYTSLLRRAIATAQITLDVADRHWIPVVRDWRINERHNGALRGLNRAKVKDQFGGEQLVLWRRSYDTPPPPIAPDAEHSQTADPRYARPRRGPAD